MKSEYCKKISVRLKIYRDTIVPENAIIRLHNSSVFIQCSFRSQFNPGSCVFNNGMVQFQVSLVGNRGLRKIPVSPDFYSFPHFLTGGSHYNFITCYTICNKTCPGLNDNRTGFSKLEPDTLPNSNGLSGRNCQRCSDLNGIVGSSWKNLVQVGSGPVKDRR